MWEIFVLMFCANTRHFTTDVFLIIVLYVVFSFFLIVKMLMLTKSSGDCDEEECELILINAIIAIFISQLHVFLISYNYSHPETISYLSLQTQSDLKFQLWTPLF